MRAVISVTVAIVCAGLAWWAVTTQKTQVRMSAFLQMQKFLEDRRNERQKILHQLSKKAADTSLSEFLKRQPDARSITVDFNDLGALLYHAHLPRKASLDLWAGMVKHHADKWLNEYVKSAQKQDPNDLRFVPWLITQANNHTPSLTQ